MCCFFFFQAEDGIRDLVRSRGLGDVYKRQGTTGPVARISFDHGHDAHRFLGWRDLGVSRLMRMAVPAEPPISRGRAVRSDLQGLWRSMEAVSYTHLRAHETVLDLVCRLLLDKKKKHTQQNW